MPRKRLYMIAKISVEHFEEVLESVSRWEAKDLKIAEKLIQKFFPAKKLISKREAAALLNCSVRQVDYLRENYGLPWARLGEVIRFDADEIRDWIETQKSTGPGCVPSLAKKIKEEAA